MPCQLSMTCTFDLSNRKRSLCVFIALCNHERVLGEFETVMHNYREFSQPGA